jgi:hypothetical protein
MRPERMPPLHRTSREREIHRLRKDIERVETWVAADASDRRAVACHRAKLDVLRSQLHSLLDEQ